MGKVVRRGLAVRAALAVGLLAAPLCPTLAPAADANGMFRIYYAGFSCGKYLQADPESFSVYKIWVEGYLTAFNEATPGLVDVLRTTDIDGLVGEVTNYCGSHPSESFAEAVVRMVKAYYTAHKAQLEQP